MCGGNQAQTLLESTAISETVLKERNAFLYKRGKVLTKTEQNQKIKKVTTKKERRKERKKVFFINVRYWYPKLNMR